MGSERNDHIVFYVLNKKSCRAREAPLVPASFNSTKADNCVHVVSLPREKFQGTSSNIQDNDYIILENNK